MKTSDQLLIINTLLYNQGITPKHLTPQTLEPLIPSFTGVKVFKIYLIVLKVEYWGTIVKGNVAEHPAAFDVL